MNYLNFENFLVNLSFFLLFAGMFYYWIQLFFFSNVLKKNKAFSFSLVSQKKRVLGPSWSRQFVSSLLGLVPMVRETITMNSINQRQETYLKKKNVVDSSGVNINENLYNKFSCYAKQLFPVEENKYNKNANKQPLFDNVFFYQNDKLNVSKILSFKEKKVPNIHYGQLIVFLANLTMLLFLLDRWLESDHFPLSNLYESLIFLSWSLTSINLWVEKIRPTKQSIIDTLKESISDTFLPNPNKTNKKTIDSHLFLNNKNHSSNKQIFLSLYKDYADGQKFDQLVTESTLYLTGVSRNQNTNQHDFTTFEKKRNLEYGPTDQLIDPKPTRQSNIKFVNSQNETYLTNQNLSLVADFKNINNERKYQRYIDGKSLCAIPNPEKKLQHNVSLLDSQSTDIFGGIITPIALIINAFASFSLPPELRESTSLVPALQSNWLIMHVTVIMLSYAALLTGCLFSLVFLLFDLFFSVKQTSFLSPLDYNKYYKKNLTETNKIIKNKHVSAQAPGEQMPRRVNNPFINNNWRRINTSIEEKQYFFDNLSYRMIGIGFLLLTVGIFSGAVWANEAWGSYWSWDPKETWALITWFIFALYLHARLQLNWPRKKVAIIACTGFVIVWICYLGVNLLGQGLHSYGFFKLGK